MPRLIPRPLRTPACHVFLVAFLASFLLVDQLVARPDPDSGKQDVGGSPPLDRKVSIADSVRDLRIAASHSVSSLRKREVVNSPSPKEEDNANSTTGAGGSKGDGSSLRLQIPLSVHFFHGFSEDLTSGGAFSLENYLSLAITYRVVRPTSFTVYAPFKLSGPWWDKSASEYSIAFEMLPNWKRQYPGAASSWSASTTAPEKLTHLKLSKLYERGGIAMDSDVLVIKPLADLLDEEFVIGADNEDGTPMSLILAARNSYVARDWLSKVTESVFDGQSAITFLRLPGTVARQLHNHITVMDQDTLVWPPALRSPLVTMYFKRAYDYSGHRAIKLHQDISRSMFWAQTSLDSIRTLDTSITCLVRHFLFNFDDASGSDRGVSTKSSLGTKSGLKSPLGACPNLEAVSPKNHLVGLWDFDEPSSTVLRDASGRRNDGVLRRAFGQFSRRPDALPVRTSPNSDDNSAGILSFDGQSGLYGFVPFDPPLSTESFTVSLWCKLPDKIETGRDVISIETKWGRISLTTRRVGGRWSSVVELMVANEMRDWKPGMLDPLDFWADAKTDRHVSTNEWHHVALTFSGDLGKHCLYIDGAIIGCNKLLRTDDIHGIWLGTRCPSDFDLTQARANDFVGSLDTVAVFDVALRMPAIAELSKSSARLMKVPLESLSYVLEQARTAEQLSKKLLPPSSLVLDLDFLNPDSSRIRDRSELQHDATISGPYQTSLLERSLQIQSSDGSQVNITVPFNVHPEQGTLAFAEVSQLTVTWFGGLSQFRSKLWSSITPIVRIDIFEGRNLGLRCAPDGEGVCFLEVAINHGYDDKVWGNIRISIVDEQPSDMHIAMVIDGNSKLGRVYHNGMELFVFSFPHRLLLEKMLVAQVDRWTSYEVQRLSQVKVWTKALSQDEVINEAAKAMSKFSILPPLSVEIALPGKQPVVVSTTMDDPSSHLASSGPFKFHSIAQQTELVSKGVVSTNDESANSKISLTPTTNALTFLLRDSIYPFSASTVIGNTSVLFVVHLEYCRVDHGTLITAHHLCLKRGDSRVRLMVPQHNIIVEWTKQCDDPGTKIDGSLPKASGSSETKPNSERLRWRDNSVFDHVHTCVSSSDIVVLQILCSLGRGYRAKWPVIRKSMFDLSFIRVFGTIIAMGIGSIVLLNASVRYDKKSLEVEDLPFISVIVPCYKQGHFLREAVNSVLTQTYSNWELIIVNDGSPDSCLEVAQQYQRDNPHLRIQAVDKPNGGLSSARNYGIERANGKWICALDADDYIDRDYFLHVARAINGNPNVRMIYANQQFFGESDYQWYIPTYTFDGLLYAGLFPVNTVYRKDDWAAVGGYTEVLPWGNEDWNLWISLASLFRDSSQVFKIDLYLLYYRYKSKSMQRDMQNFLEVVPMLQTLHPDLYPARETLDNHRVIIQEINRKTVDVLRQKLKRHAEDSMLSLWLGMYHEGLKDLSTASRYYQKAVETNKDPKNWQPYFRLAVARATGGECKEANALFDKAASIDKVLSRYRISCVI
ncbi:hypothetical protein HDU93_001648 [Gonapodya sp. JEL0774]|nr:hypothetical protein HDU93_001648 [Gonapodya sp. JEL0774]